MKLLKRNLDLEKTRKNYKRIVDIYNLWGLLTESKAVKCAVKFAEIKDYTTVLEVACGTGVVFERIVKLNPNGKNIGIDLSPDMLGKAKKRLKTIM